MSVLYATKPGSDIVSVIDTATNTVTVNIGVGHLPVGIAVNPTGTRAYTANFGTNDV